MARSSDSRACKNARFAGLSPEAHTSIHTCGFVSERTTLHSRLPRSSSTSVSPLRHIRLWKSDSEPLVYTGLAAASLAASFFSRTTS